MSMAIYTQFFHGSHLPIESFDYAFCGRGNDQLGSGFYFTSSPRDAAGYAFMAAERSCVGYAGVPIVHEVEIHAGNLLRADACALLTRAQVAAIAARAPEIDDRLWDFGDVAHEGKAKVFARLAATYAREDEPLHLIRRLNAFASDIFGNTPEAVQAFNRAVFDVLGFDGVTEDFVDVDGSIKSTHICVFFPEQIKILARVPAQVHVQAPEDDAASHERPRAR